MDGEATDGGAGEASVFVNAADQLSVTDLETEAIMAQALADHGLLDPAMLTNSALQNADTANSLDAEIYAPATFTREYNFDGVPTPPPETGITNERWLNFQEEVREMLKDNRIPASVGGDMMRRMLGTFGKEAVPETQLMATKHSAMDYLSKLWGHDRDANLHLANLLVDRMDTCTPGFKAWLRHSGEANNPMTIVALYNAVRVNWSK